MNGRREKSLADLIVDLVAAAPRTGYEICRALEEDEIPGLRGQEGAIYAALVQLVREGWLVAEVEETERGPRRTYSLPVLVDAAEAGR